MPSPSKSDDFIGVTIDVTTTLGKRYSVERYYMLSEIEEHSLQPVYLDEHQDRGDNKSDTKTKNKTDGSKPSFGTSDSGSDSDSDPIAFPPFIILYLIWYYDPKDDNRARMEAIVSFREGPVRGAIHKLKRLWSTTTRAPPKTARPKKPRVYVVIDVLVKVKVKVTPSPDAKRSDECRTQEFQTMHVPIAEELARGILRWESDGARTESSHDDGIDLAGVTVGLADHPRAAPGLESCLEAISIGSRDRRKHGATRGDGSCQKSGVGIVCNSVQDLVGFDEEGETDAVQGVIQSRTEAALPDKGEASPLVEFARGAHRYWRVHTAGWTPEPTSEEQLSDAHLDANDTASVMWIITIAIAVGSWYWKYGST
mmetsp:Transcript_1777/g.4664  ORF Transcript_1777/g.4664 Transcript_1777/m.4664 type:complete len:369 (-) Transcript_1777:35-1141(-)